MTKLIVLIVDDNRVSRLLPSVILGAYSEQVQVLECETGEEALRLLNTHPITHVLLDISMPGMDGIQVVQALKNTTTMSANVRLIAYTADALVNNPNALAAIGFEGVLLKPLQADALIEALGVGRVFNAIHASQHV